MKHLFMKASLMMCCVSILFNAEAQVIDNKGNRLQSYPVVEEVDEFVYNVVNQVNIDSLLSTVQWMQDLGCRDAQSQEALLTQNYLLDKYELYGYDTYLHFFPCTDSYYGYCTEYLCDGDTLAAGNVVAVKYGSEYPEEIIVISSHYDHPDGPGADDNASGCAGVVECARLLQYVDTKRTIMFVNFNAEEYWLVGSKPFAEKMAVEDKDIIAVFNLDMLGFFPEDIEQVTMGAGASYIALPLWNYYQQVANLYVEDVPTLRFSTGDSYGGDHLPFNIHEYPALYIGDIEYHNAHPCYHQLCDTIGNGLNNFLLFESFAKATLAASLLLANECLPPQNLAVLNSDTALILKWEGTDYANRYKVFKNGILLSETVDTVAFDCDVCVDSTYYYHVAAVHDDGRESAPSNVCHSSFVGALNLPFSQNFEENCDGFTSFSTSDNSWTLTDDDSFSGNYSLTNTTMTSLPDNYYATAELNWFGIPDNVEDITVSFALKAVVRSIWENANLYFEVSRDRVNWVKLGTLSTGSTNWEKYSFSLNDYIGEPFVQFCFRFESTGADNRFYRKTVHIDDFEVDYEASPFEYVDNRYDSSFGKIIIYPNPVVGQLNVKTDYLGEYNLSVFDEMGVKVFENKNFTNGDIDLSFLPSGIYLIKMTNGSESVGKRVVVF